ncbi:violaxanthin de-epoxidase [Cucumis melo var. makuwa]|uniref:Violaxanthin de-epoxidase n=1 Tax=Cucumis melo var. makuwa TaxID=1194695 RepID=A0A5D3CR73_CUCMM|nr:violaxanthin de-epoxidase [Cucumis melo var. makuwa]TYK13688.1 violaxanthin de-epoxidase [Cucumis melo var. makuwa]
MKVELYLNSGTSIGNGWPLNPNFHFFLSHRKPTHSPTLSMPSHRPTVSRRLLTVPPPVVAEANKNAAMTDTPVRIVAIVGEGSISPLKSTPWEEVMLHTAKRLKWVDEGYEMHVFADNVCNVTRQDTGTIQIICEADILVVVAVTSKDSVLWIRMNCENIQNIICFESAAELVNKLGGISFRSETKGNLLENFFGNSQLLEKRKKSEEVVQTVFEAWDRRNSDDIRKALQCLNQCCPVDQVCNYRCIASYESPNLEAFSLCVLQKHNILDLDAKIPEKPYVPPIERFRGKELCHETAEDLFIGGLGSLEWSWRVVAGQNPAYTRFPCQYQLFYRGKARGSFWYEPVFMVKTLEGKMVWRRRRYRVKRGKIAGTFLFSVFDNGVVANEFWSIVDVCDDLSWGLFHYNGAARTAGQSYTGAVLVSRDGKYPENDDQKERIVAALEKCGIKEWELFVVDHSSCLDPPLGIPDGSTLHYVIEVK